MSPSEALDCPALLHNIWGGGGVGVLLQAWQLALWMMHEINGVYTCNVAHGTRVDPAYSTRSRLETEPINTNKVPVKVLFSAVLYCIHALPLVPFPPPNFQFFLRDWLHTYLQ